ncbi:TonB-dependent receptor [Rhodoplanes sp. TEM]|uniref:TonB-dependent receptor n=2 Tax=Rhodoplanes TaxID=29407 RepID=A0ABT5J8D1_RHOTP|nr:TonB-dependent receptor [Rhodoplanes tepidamans]MDC7785910.1 TonB-dependent receptor [Rhodoplanes tepidamans]MDC7987995.1 TonB-dependent receptor [Rhodoplanes sp. TEM]MDQ0355472.1 iron complex outermembrane receptor protein [Rhodoplanes tepidamans]
MLVLGGEGLAQTAGDLPAVTVAQPKPRPKPAPTVRARPRPRPAPAATATPAPAAAVAAPAVPSGPRWNEPVTTALQGTPAGVQATSTGPATTATESQIIRDPAAQLGDVLFTRPGVTSTTFAPGASRPVIRGLESVRVRVQENGIGSHDVSDLGEDHGVPIDPLASKKIEIIRGPGTLRYSSQAIGGIASASNDRIPDVLPQQGIHGEIRGSAATVDKSYDGAILLDAAHGNTVVHVDAFGRRALDYQIPGGVQLNSKLNNSGESAGVTRFFDNGFAGFAIQHYESLYHVPGTESAENDTRIKMNQTKVTGRGEWRMDGGPFEAFRWWVGATNYKHDEIGLGEDGVDAVRATFVNRQQEARAELAHVPVVTGLGLLTGVIGADTGHRDIDSAGEAGGLIGPSTTNRAAAYALEQLRFAPTWSVVAAGRIEYVKVDGTATTFSALLPPADITSADTSRDFLPVSVSAALVKDLPWDVTASLTLEHKERAPGPLELYAKGAHDATGTFEIGDANLKKEKMNAVELGFKKQTGMWRFEANAYWRYFDGYIFRQFTGNRCGEEFDTCGDPDGEFLQVTYTQLDADFRGVELYSQVDVAQLFGGIVTVEGQYDYLRATFTDGTNVPRIPPMRLGGGLSWRDANWLARVNFIHAFAQDDPGENETATPGYNQLKAELSYTGKILDPRSPFTGFTVGAVGDNLLNDDIRNSVSFRKDEVLLPGRSFRAFATLRF